MFEIVVLFCYQNQKKKGYHFPINLIFIILSISYVKYIMHVR